MRFVGLKNASNRAHKKYNATPNIRCTDKLRALIVLGLSVNLANKLNPNGGCRTNHSAIKVTSPYITADVKKVSLLTIKTIDMTYK